MRKFIALVLLLICVLALAACAEKSGIDSYEPDGVTSSHGEITEPDMNTYSELPKDLNEIPGATIHIVDIWDIAEAEQLVCADAEEKFWEDETAEYYFSCIKSQHIIVMDSTGRTIDIVTALNEGLATIADLDYYGIEYYTEPKLEVVEPHVSIADFSYAEDSAIYVEGDPGVKTSGFVNTSEVEIKSITDADECAMNECTIEWDTINTYLDTAAGIWKVVFSTGTPGGCQSVYLDYDGKTVLIVYGE